MNIAAIKTEVAEAASSVADVNVSAGYRQVTRPGDGLVRFDNLVRDVTGFGWIVTVQVFILVPQSLAAAEAWIADHLDALADALAPAFVLTGVAPVQLALDTGVVPALQLTGTRAD